MKRNVSNRALDDLMNFLYRNAINDECKVSINHIAERLRYGGSTIHRALQILAEQGKIKIAKSQNPTEPNTITIIKTEVKDGTITEGNKVCAELAKIAKDTTELICKLQRINEQQQRDLEVHKKFRERIINIQPINDELENAIMRKEL